MPSLFRLRGPRTRYFSFVKLGSSNGDIERLMDECTRIDACPGFKVVDTVLSGIIVLRGVQTYVCDMELCFKGFEIGLVKSDKLVFDCDWIFSNGDLPYEDVRKRLFNDNGKKFLKRPVNAHYKRTLKCMGAPDDWEGSVDDWMFFEGKTESQEKMLENWSVGIRI